MAMDPAWLVPEACEQALEEPLRRTMTPSLLRQDIQHHAVLVHIAPAIVKRTINAQKHLIKVLGVARPQLAPS